jgi:hypothetical protein
MDVSRPQHIRRMFIDGCRGVLVYTNEGPPYARFPEMPDSCYCTGDAGDHTSFPTFGENMEPKNQAVRLLKGALARCSNIPKNVLKNHTRRDPHHRSG